MGDNFVVDHKEKLGHEPPAGHGVPVAALIPPLAVFTREHRASLLYGISAISLLYGIGAVFGPVLASSDIAGDKLPALGALNLYELGLLGLLLGIVQLRRSLNDAVLLTILAVVFLCASGIALSSFAINAPPLALGIGLACLAGAALKGYVLRRHVGVPFGWTLGIACGTAIAWNFIGPALLARKAEQALPAMAEPMALWQVGWLLVLAGMMLPCVAGLRRSPGYAMAAPAALRFQRPEMAWAITALLFAGVAIHQFETAYIFDLPVQWVDYLPAALVACLLLGEALCAFHAVPRVLYAAIALLPIPAGVFAAWHSPGHLTGGGVLDAFAQLDLVFVLGALWLLLRSVLQRDLGSLLGAAAYGLAAALFYRATWHVYAPEIGALNWIPASSALLAMVLLIAVLRRDPTLLYAVLVLVTLGWILFDPLGPSLGIPLSTVLQSGVLTYGFGGLLLSILFRSVFVAAVPQAHAIVILLVFATLPDGALASWLVCAAALAAGALLFRQRRDLVAPILLAFPGGWQLVLSMSPITPWHFIGLAFVLLAAGGTASLWWNGPGAMPVEHATHRKEH